MEVSEQEQPNSLAEKIRDKYQGKTITDAASPAGNWMQMQLEHVARGTVTLSMIVRPEMSNPYGHAHGGMMALIIDETIGWSVVSLNAGQHYTTLNLNVDFLYGVKVGERVIAKAAVIREGKKILHVSCEVHDAQGKLLARAASNLVATGMKPA